MSNYEDFLSLHDQALKAADHAYSSGDTSRAAMFLHRDLHGYFGNPKSNSADQYGYEECLEGMRQTAKSFPGTKSGFSNRCVRMPSESEAVVFFDKSMDLGQTVVHAMVMEVWRCFDGKWMIVREVVEHA